MLTTTDEQVREAIASSPKRYQDAGGKWLPVAVVADLLCSGELLDNPTPQADVPKPLDVDAAIKLLSPATCAKLAALPPIVDFVDKANSGNRAGAMRWIGLATKGGILTMEEAGALAALASQTVKDATWQPKILGSPPLTHTNHEQVKRVMEGLTP